MIDSHCHLHPPYQFAEDAGYLRMREAGVKGITIGTTLTSSREAVAYAQAHEGVWASVGVHPCHAHKATLHGETEGVVEPEDMASKEWQVLARAEKVIAIGEVGLDVFRVKEEEKAEVLMAQERVLTQAIRLATDSDKPLVCHVRDAHARMQELLRETIDTGLLPRRGVIHCFTGTLEEASAYHALGFFTSLPGIITFTDKKNPHALTPLQIMASKLPLEWTLLETDAPFLAPEPHRGKPNEPAFIWETAKCLARLKGMPVEEVLAYTDANAGRLFGI